MADGTPTDGDLEAGGSKDESSATLTTTQEAPHHHHHTNNRFIIHAGHKIRHFLLPDGKKVHIASHPEQEQSLRRHLSIIQPENDFDIVVSIAENVTSITGAEIVVESLSSKLQSALADSSLAVLVTSCSM